MDEKRIFLVTKEHVIGYFNTNLYKQLFYHRELQLTVSLPPSKPPSAIIIRLNFNRSNICHEYSQSNNIVREFCTVKRSELEESCSDKSCIRISLEWREMWSLKQGTEITLPTYLRGTDSTLDVSQGRRRV